MPPYTFFSFDAGFSSLGPEGPMDTWAFECGTSINGPWSPGDIHRKGGLKPSLPQSLTQSSQIWFNIYDKDYSTGPNKPNLTKLVNLTYSFGRKDGLTGPPSPFTANGTASTLIEWMVAPSAAIPPLLTNWVSPVTNEAGGLWVVGSCPSTNSTQPYNNVVYSAANIGKFRCTVAITILMPDGSTKIFTKDPEMDVTEPTPVED